MLRNGIALVLGLCAIVFCYLLGEWLQPLLPIPVPAALIGLLLLFSILVLLGKLPKVVELACAPLLRHMSVFFVPATLAVVNYSDQLAEHAVLLFVALVITTLISLVITALLARWITTGNTDAS